MSERRPLTPEAVRLDDRVAIVTGAAHGIGRAIATSFARFGASVAVCDRDADGLGALESEIRSESGEVATTVLDVRDTTEVESWVGDVASQSERIDVVVNNVGGGFHAPFAEVSRKGQHVLVDENFTSMTNVTRAAIPHIPDSGGSVINITSIEAHRAGPGYAIYSAMKAAVASLTKSLALELGDRRIRVNCIAPDVIPTPGVGGELAVTTPLTVAGHVDDVAGAAVFLASDLSQFVTGTTVHVDGGNWAAGGWFRHRNGEFLPSSRD